MLNKKDHHTDDHCNKIVLNDDFAVDATYNDMMYTGHAVLITRLVHVETTL